MSIPAKQLSPACPGPLVEVTNRRLFVHGWDDNLAVVDAVAAADDPGQAFTDWLGIGYDACQAASAMIDTTTVEQRFETMATTFAAALAQLEARFAEVTGELLDENDGVVGKVLRGCVEDIASTFGDFLDEDRASSALGKIDQAMNTAQTRFIRTVRADLDPDADGSSMKRAMANLTAVFKQQSGVILSELRDIALKMAKEDGRAEIVNLTTAKGFTFEDLIDRLCGEIAAIHGDTSERVGRQSGTAGSQKGDQLVTINPDDTGSRDGRFILECKDRKLSRAKALEELTECMDNHDATAGIIIFAGQALAPTPVPFSHQGNRAILVMDKDDPDQRLFALGYAWARWVVRRSLAGETGDTVDWTRIEGAIDTAQQGLAIITSIKAAHSGAKKKIDDAGDLVARLVREVDAALGVLRQELN